MKHREIMGLSVFLTACMGSHPLLQDDVGQRLRRITPLNAPSEAMPPAASGATADLELPAELRATASQMAGTSPSAVFKLDLMSLRKYALENNFGLLVDLYGPALARASYDAERAKFDAIIGLSGQYSKSYSVDKQGTDTMSLQPSVSLPMVTGGSMSLSLPHTRSQAPDFQNVDPATGLPLSTTTTYSPGLNFSLSQPLLKDAGVGVNMASIRTSLLSLRQADARAKLAVIRLLADAERAYWNHYCATRNLELQLEQFRAAEEQVRIAKRLVEEGVHTRIEVTRAQSGVATRFESIIRAESNRRRNQRELKRLMNLEQLPVESTTLIVLETKPQLRRLTLQRADVVTRAHANRMELFDNEVQQLVDRLTIATRQNALLPGLTADFSYSFSGSKPAFRDALSQLFDKALNKVTVGFTVTTPLTVQAAKARLRSAVLSLAITRANRRLLEQAITKEVHDAIDNLEHNWQRLLSNRVAVVLAAQTYKAERVQFQVGETTSTEVIRALQTLSQAQGSELQSICDYHIAVVDVAFATGTVLGQSGVTWSSSGASK